MTRNVILCVLMLLCAAPVFAEEPREIFSEEIEAGIDAVWDAFTTTEGLKSWVAPLADVDFKVGGAWRANYNPDGELGDATTIVNTIMSYDPKRMLSIRATGFPEGFPFEAAAKKTWSVFYFESLSETRTKVTAVGLGYDDTEQGVQMRSYFKAANKVSMDKLKAALEAPADTGSDAEAPTQ